MTRDIELQFVRTSFFTRWPCTVCGGNTEKVIVLCEGRVNPDVESTIRVCERCLEAGDIDGRLERHAEYLEAFAERVRSLIGRLNVPTYAAWQDAEKRNDVADFALHSTDDPREAQAAFDGVLADDAAYAEWRDRYARWKERAWPARGPAAPDAPAAPFPF